MADKSISIASRSGDQVKLNSGPNCSSCCAAYAWVKWQIHPSKSNTCQCAANHCGCGRNSDSVDNYFIFSHARMIQIYA